MPAPPHRISHPRTETPTHQRQERCGTKNQMKCIQRHQKSLAGDPGDHPPILVGGKMLLMRTARSRLAPLVRRLA